MYHMCTLSVQGDTSQNLFPIDEKKPKLAFDSAEDYERYATFHMCVLQEKNLTLYFLTAVIHLNTMYPGTGVTICVHVHCN